MLATNRDSTFFEVITAMWYTDRLSSKAVLGEKVESLGLEAKVPPQLEAQGTPDLQFGFRRSEIEAHCGCQLTEFHLLFITTVGRTDCKYLKLPLRI